MNKYDLTEKQFNECLKRAELQLFLRSKPVTGEQPYAVYIISQPGGGKTGLRTFIEQEYSEKRAKCPFIEFDPDEIALYHENYTDIQREYPNESYKILQKFVSPAIDNYLRPKAIKLKNNIIQEGTFSNKQVFLKILDSQKNGIKSEIENNDESTDNINNKYYVDINLLAVHRYESLLSCYEREQGNIESNITPRAVTAENHDRAYYNVLETLNSIENQKLFNRIRIFKRGKKACEPELVYITEGNNYGTNIIDILKAIRDEDKKRIMDNPLQYLNRIENLESRIQNNGTEIQLKKLHELKKEFVQELQKYREGEEK